MRQGAYLTLIQASLTGHMAFASPDWACSSHTNTSQLVTYPRREHRLHVWSVLPSQRVGVLAKVLLRRLLSRVPRQPGYSSPTCREERLRLRANGLAWAWNVAQSTPAPDGTANLGANCGDRYSTPQVMFMTLRADWAAERRRVRYCRARTRMKRRTKNELRLCA